MNDCFVSPSIIWKIKFITTRPLKRTLHFLESKWSLILDINANSDLVKMYLFRETVPKNSSLNRVRVTSGLRDCTGTLRYIDTKLLTDHDSEPNCIWKIKRICLLDENLWHGDSLSFACMVEPTDNWEKCLENPDTAVNREQLVSEPCMTSLSEDFKRLLQTPIEPDVRLECCGEIIAAHRAILSCRSTVFSAMFTSGMKEARVGIVNIQGIQPGVFAALIIYIYTGKVVIRTVEFAKKVYMAADIYDVTPLKQKCVDYLKSNLRRDNVLDVLQLADIYVDIDLKNCVIDSIIEMQFLLTREWDAFSEQNPNLTLDVYKEFLAREMKLRSLSTSLRDT